MPENLQSQCKVALQREIGTHIGNHADWLCRAKAENLQTGGRDKVEGGGGGTASALVVTVSVLGSVTGTHGSIPFSGDLAVSTAMLVSPSIKH